MWSTWKRKWMWSHYLIQFITLIWHCLYFIFISIVIIRLWFCWAFSGFALAFQSAVTIILETFDLFPWQILKSSCIGGMLSRFWTDQDWQQKRIWIILCDLSLTLSYVDYLTANDEVELIELLVQLFSLWRPSFESFPSSGFHAS